MKHVIINPDEEEFFDPVPFALSVDEAARIAGASRTAIYEALNRRELGGKKQGRRTVILKDALREYLNALPDYRSKR